MNGGGGLWIGGSTSSGASEKTINSSFMLKFRPIAPKPADGKSFSGVKPPEIIKKVILKKTTKRKYVSVRKTKNTNPSKKTGPAVTLQLMPEKNESPKSPDRESTLGSARDMNIPTSNFQVPETCEHVSDTSIMKIFLKLSEHEIINETSSLRETLVTIESMTDAYVEAIDSLGSNDSEILRNLEVDTCPGFVTDRYNKVGLVNDAFVRLVSGGEDKDGRLPGVAVRLVVREEPPCGRNAFTCRVRINYTWRKEKCPKMVPCDVWRLDGGGFAWRLDLKAALGLGF